MPRGGARPGSGRKPKDKATAALHGSQRKSVVRFPSPAGQMLATAPSLATEAVACPEPLSEQAQAVWDRLAPFALAAQTLTAGTGTAFALLCRQIVLERVLAE